MRTEYFYFDERANGLHEAYIRSLAEGSEEPENTGGLDMIRRLSRAESRPLEPVIRANPRLLELQTARRF
jgi:hypothetical protein